MKKMIRISMFCIIIFIIVSRLNVSKATYNQVTVEANSSNNNGISNFPASYQKVLNKLVDDTGHTNWKFEAYYTDIDWNTLVANEIDCLHNTIYKSPSNPYSSSWYDSCGKQGDKNYYCASSAITSYYMDPRNFLTEKTIFQFLNLSNSTEVSVQDIRDAVKGTYLSGSANGEEYAQMIYDAANASGESAFSIITRIFQELGNGTSLPYMISGTDSTYPGVYNFFNYGATDGAGNLARGLAYAKNAGWTTPQKALIEGAKLISGTYTKVGQVNKYLYKFDVVGIEDSQLFSHQYMTNVQDPNSQASILYNTYDTSDLLDKSLTFVIPIYRNMPAYVKLPDGSTSGNLYYVSSTYDAVNYRDETGTIKGSNKKDTVVTMLQENAATFNGIRYGKVSYNGKTEYIAMQYLTPVNTVQDEYNVPNQSIDYTGTNKDENATVSYKAQLQDIGWTNWAKDSETIGNIGGSRRLETINIVLNKNLKDENLQYRVHVQDYGWMDWKSEGEDAGTIGESKRIEAIEIKLREKSDYQIYYRVYIEGQKWTSWVKNGETAGTTGQSKKVTAIEIKIEENYIKNNVGEQYKGTKSINSNSLINYNTYIEEAGWMGWSSDGESSGSSGQNRKMNSIKIQLGNKVCEESITYRVHIQNVGWTDWVSGGTALGDSNKNLRIEAIQVKLSDNTTYNVKYRVHVQDVGWMSWKQNGETAGTVGESKRIEAIQIKLESTGNISICYSSHVQDYGWQNWVKNGTTSGTEGKSKRIEALEIKLAGIDSSITNAIQYRSYIEGKKWSSWSYDGAITGTVGESKRIEAIQIKLNCDIGKNIIYRVHVQDYGWTDWKSNGETAGYEGKSKRIEAIQIMLIPTNNISIQYSSHVQDYGWMSWKSNGELSGTTAQSKRIEALKIKISGIDSGIQNLLQYRVHVQDYGWMSWKQNGEIAGTTGMSKRIEAIQIKLSSVIGKKIKYRVHVQDYGWMDWKSNGEIAGTTGQSKRIEAIEIKLEN